MDKVNALLKKVRQGRVKTLAAKDQLDAAVRDGRNLAPYFAQVERCLADVEPLIQELAQVVEARKSQQKVIPLIIRGMDGQEEGSLEVPAKYLRKLERIAEGALAKLGGGKVSGEIRFRIDGGWIVFPF